MMYIKVIGLVVAVAAALATFAGTASATTLKSSSGATPTISAESTSLVLTGPFTEVKCNRSTLHGVVASHGAGVTVKVPLTKGGLSFSECNLSWTVIKEGFLEFHGNATTGNGTVTWSEAVIELHTSVGICRLETGFATHIGTLTGSNATGSHAVLDIKSTVPFNGTSFFCGGSGTLEGSYTISSPKTLEVH